jgi:hypothetical protein
MSGACDTHDEKKSLQDFYVETSDELNVDGSIISKWVLTK